LTFIFVFARWVRADQRDIANKRKMCFDDFALSVRQCNADGQLSPEACFNIADKESAECLKPIARTWSELFAIWGLYAVSALFWAYIAVLATRTIGWVVLGFSQQT
jgi:hypothetical protein